MESPFVRCEVNTCTHWLPGELCGADNIDILHEEEGRMSENSEQTECKTFYKKGGVTSYLGSADNVNWGGLVSEVVTPGQQATPSVTCVVDTCQYWEDGDLCVAEEIRVTGENADECQDTNCGTFLPADGE